MTGDQTPDPVGEEHAALERVREFVNAGVRAQRISSESAELLIGAAERHHDEQVEAIYKAGRFLP